jgi:hypothetical protein
MTPKIDTIKPGQNQLQFENSKTSLWIDMVSLVVTGRFQKRRSGFSLQN